MPDQLQLRGGTTVQHSTFTGSSKEVTVDTTKKTAVVHDGSTVGGNPLMREDASNSALALGSAAAPSLKFTGDPNTGVYSPGADQLAVATNGTGRLFIDASGNITTDTNHTSSKVSIVNSATVSTYDRILGLRSDTLSNAFLGLGNDSLYIAAATSAPMIFCTNSDGGVSGTSVPTNERLRITSAGLVGIGTSSPTEALHVVGSAILTGAVSVGTTASATSLQFPAVTGWGPRIQQGGASINDFGIFTNNTEHLTVKNSGNVGIGTTTPDKNLVVNQSNPGADVGIRIKNNTTTDAGTTASLRFTTSTADFDTAALVADRATGSLRHEYGGSEKARLTSDGKLLIGTSSARAGYAGGNNFTPYFQIEGNSDGTRFYSFTNNSSAIAPAAPVLNLTRSRSSSIGGTTLVQSGDWLGALSFNGYDGTNPIEAATIKGEVDGTPGTNDMPGRLVFSTTADGASSTTERMRITSDGNVLVGKTSSSFGAGDGTVIGGAGYLAQTRTSATPFTVIRNGTDGTLVSFEAQNVEEGTISVSGTTVSYNGAHLSRWSQLPSGAERTEILRGSVLSNLDEMCEWIDPPTEAVLWEEGDELPEGVNVGDIKEPVNPGGPQSNEQLNRMKVSDVEGDKNVSGVFQAWDDDDDTYTNDFYCAMTGDFIIRIAEGVIVERGDLLMSAGDGTAKPQNDDIIRSKTIAKVTSTNVSCTYEDGSYCVPCVLMAC
jgi:hypothetical protein